jgi:GNAT superfamily N-acetyltransferase
MWGMSSLWKSGDGIEILETGLTGVRRDYHRRGIAKALKSYIIEVAQRLGAQVIQAYNEENNPMFQLNLQLGFQAHPADLEWEKTLDGGRLGQAIP